MEPLTGERRPEVPAREFQGFGAGWVSDDRSWSELLFWILEDRFDEPPSLSTGGSHYSDNFL